MVRFYLRKPKEQVSDTSPQLGGLKMLSYLQSWEEILGPLRLFQFISVRAILAGISALFIGFNSPVIIGN